MSIWLVKADGLRDVVEAAMRAEAGSTRELPPPRAAAGEASLVSKNSLVTDLALAREELPKAATRARTP